MQEDLSPHPLDLVPSRLQISREFVAVDLSYYRVAPKACVGHSSLAAIAACSRKTSQSGLGIRVRLDERCDSNTGLCLHKPQTKYPALFWGAHCEPCWRSVVAASDERREIVERIAERFNLGVHGNSLCRSRQPVFLHICRGNVGKKHVALAKKVLAATARAFRQRGYEVDADGSVA